MTPTKSGLIETPAKVKDRLKAAELLSKIFKIEVDNTQEVEDVVIYLPEKGEKI